MKVVVTVEPDGQISLPDIVLKHLGVGPGDTVITEKYPDNTISVRAATRAGQIVAATGSP